MDVEHSIKLVIVGLIGILSIHISDLFFLFELNNYTILFISLIHMLFYIIVFAAGYSLCKYTYTSRSNGIISLLAAFCCIISVYLDILCVIRIAFPLIDSLFTSTGLRFILLFTMHILLLITILLIVYFKIPIKSITFKHIVLLILLCVKSIFLLLVGLTPNIMISSFILVKVISNSIDCVILTLIILSFKSFIISIIKNKYSKNTILNIKGISKRAF